MANQDYFNNLKEGRGHLTPNRFKKADNHPDYKGHFKLNGTIMEVAGWSNTKEDGTRVMSLSVSTYNPPQQQGPPNQQWTPGPPPQQQQPQQYQQPQQQRQDGTSTAGPRENVW